MKRYGHLWPGICSFANLHRAAKKACYGKRFRSTVARFHFVVEQALCRLEEELKSKTYRPGRYRTFLIYEPKQRLISAAPYRDRVVHHALCNVLEPIFERRFIQDSYACRKGKGTHAAVDRCQRFARQFRYVLKADVRKFFPSMDHETLKGLLARQIKDPDVLWLAGLIIDHSNPQEPVIDWFPDDDLFTPSERRRGIPIGNQTSQFFANVYLDPLDHFIKDRLGVKGYVRYVDDFLVFSDDKRQLHRTKAEVEHFLERLRLRLHPDKSVVFPTTQGIWFLGYRVFPTHRLLAQENVWRFRRRMQRLAEKYADGVIALPDIRQRLLSWLGHAGHANTYRLRTKLFRKLSFQRAATVQPRVSWRVLEQPTEQRSFGEPEQEHPRQPERLHRLPRGEHFAAGR